MGTLPTRNLAARRHGFSTIEVVVTLSITLIVASMVVPAALQVVKNVKLRSSAGDLAGLMQQARILAAKNNASPGYPMRFTTLNGAQVAYIDLDGDGGWTTNEPLVQLGGTVTITLNTPPAAYVLAGDSGGVYPSTTVLGFSPRGLPCPYVDGPPATCTTPAANYFVYYLTNGESGWAAVAVSKAGRTRVATWNGTVWK